MDRHQYDPNVGMDERPGVLCLEDVAARRANGEGRQPSTGPPRVPCSAADTRDPPARSDQAGRRSRRHRLRHLPEARS